MTPVCATVHVTLCHDTVCAFDTTAARCCSASAVETAAVEADDVMYSAMSRSASC